MLKRLLLALMLLTTMSGCVMEADLPGVYVRGHYGDRDDRYERGGYYHNHGSHHGGYYHHYSDHRDAGHEW